MSKLCIDCKHCVGTHNTPITQYIYIEALVFRCTRESKINLVNGAFTGPFYDCENERENALRLEQFRCGVDAKYFEHNA